MTRLMRALAALLVLYASPVQAAITCEGTGVQAAQTTDPATLSYTFPANSNQLTFLAIHDRSETNSITSVSGGSCTWTLRAGPFDLSTATAIRLWLYVGNGCTSGAGTISVDLGATQNSHLAAASCWADSAMTFISAGGAGAEGSGTAVVTEALSVSATGVVVAAIAVSNAVSISSVNSANSDDMTAAASRAFLVRRLESSGSTSIDVTIGSSSFESAVVLYQEGGGGGGGSGGKNLTLTGVGY